ncbi:DUF4235 domain-containing protein [Enemella sp. A6]|uniref:DUF4235 domain-containing protein n=1 Tax=Enemella sp. A6 TaxID=3440152 RepID=UPI003EBEE387
MGVTSKAIWKIYSTVFSLIVAALTAKLLSKGWQVATGEEPPDAQDPDTPTSKALTWAVASAVGVVVSQLLTKRFAEQHWAKEMGASPLEKKKGKAGKAVKVSF